MATYKEIQAYVKGRYGFVPKTCWIADVKDRYGLTVRKAWNRESEERRHPCPSQKMAPILDALRHFDMI